MRRSPFPITVALGCALALAPAVAWAEASPFDVEREFYPGLRILERTSSSPHIYAALVDLCEDGVRVEARSPQASRITAPAWGEAMGAQLAVNGDFYRTDRTVPTVYGDAVGVGVRWPPEQSGLGAEFESEWYYQNYGWIGFGPDLAEFTHTGWVKDNADDYDVADGFSPRDLTTELPDGITALVSGFSQLVVEGQPLTEFPDRSDLSDRHPRTAMGLTEDRQTFILVVVDGRSTQSAGMRGSELAALMGELGAYVAFNLDGGGSTQMWLAGEGLINQPSGGSARSVANHWGIFAGGEGEPGSCVRSDDDDGGDGGGEPDAGVGGADAGPVTWPDAGTVGGGGASASAQIGGCSAAAGGSPLLPALGLLVALLWPRRSVRTRAA